MITVGSRSSNGVIMQLGKGSTFGVIRGDQEDNEAFQHSSTEQENIPRVKAFEAYST
jgi:hypothetical protein